MVEERSRAEETYQLLSCQVVRLLSRRMTRLPGQHSSCQCQAEVRRRARARPREGSSPSDTAALSPRWSRPWS